jgi:hypothetical protein
MKRLETILSIGLLALPLAFGQSNGGGSQSNSPSQSQKTKKDKVTTDDSVYKPNGGPGDKASDDAKNKRQQTPPNPPVVSPHEDPTSPVNRPKEGNVPESGKAPEK